MPRGPAYLRVFALLGAGLVTCQVLGQKAPSPAKVSMTTLTPSVYEASRGTLEVPQFHEQPEAGSLQLAFVVLRSGAPEPGPPVFFLNGIPGSATAMRDSPLWEEHLKSADVVLLDQRGCGQSEPRLMWSGEGFRAERLFGNTAQALDHALQTATAIRAFAEQRGVHLSAFNTRESARDIEALRAALGYDTFDIIGHSGGAHLGLEYLRQHPERVAHFASLGTAGPNDIHALPARLDQSLRQVSALAAADSRIGKAMPNLFERIVALLKRLEQQPLEIPVAHPSSGEQLTLSLGRYGLQFILLLDLGDPADFVVFPRLVHELEQGRTDTVSWFVRRRYRQMSDWPAVLFINRGSSGATAERWAMIRSQAMSSPFGMVRCLFSPEIDAAFGVQDLGDEFRKPVESDVPSLFVSGSLDANTPPERATDAMRGFSQAQHLLVENGGHDSLLDRPEVHEAIRAFFDEQAQEPATIALPTPTFALLDGADDLVRHPSLP